MGLLNRQERVALIPDIHCPYEDKRAVSVAAQIVEAFKPTRVIFIGDFIDAHWASNFKKNQATIPGELERELSAWESVRKLFPAKQVQVLLGNHERRVQDWLNEQPALAQWKEMEPSRFWRLGTAQLVKEGFIALARGRFLITHGKICRKWSGHSAKAEMSEVWGCSGASGHTHRLGKYYQRDGTSLRVWMELGHLSRPRPHYAAPNEAGPPNWQQGLGLLYIDGDHFHADDIAITLKYRAMFNGHVYKA